MSSVEQKYYSIVVRQDSHGQGNVIIFKIKEKSRNFVLDFIMCGKLHSFKNHSDKVDGKGHHLKIQKVHKNRCSVGHGKIIENSGNSV